MDNPPGLSAGQDRLESIHALARDLAYGVAHGLQGTGFRIF